ncbi:MAG: SPOR domain-containing protein, partial [Candidatus Caenarcaniphilales bacterium]|nr:SPOR domain-containing protein [Candidatus Caenarcaniphilales bacterium]
IEAGKGLDQKAVYRVNSISQYNSRVEAKNALANISPQQGIIMPAINSSESTLKTVSTSSTTSSTAKTSTATSNVTKASNTSTKNLEFGIQFGAFGTQSYAKDMQNKLLVDKGIKTIIHQFPDDDKKLYRVLTNHAFSSRAEADGFLEKNAVQGVILTFVK